VKEVQLAFFSDTEKIKTKKDLVCKAFWIYADKILRRIVDPFLPKGTRRRERIKDVFYKVTSGKRRGVASIERGK